MSKLTNLITLRLAMIMQNPLESLEREEGQTLAEYALILALIAIVVATAVGLLGTKISSLFNNVASQL